MPPPKKTTLPAVGLRCLIVLVLSLVFTAFCVGKSRQIGRLATSPNYDDCVYFYQSTVLLQEVKSHGIAGLSTFLTEQGLHSPYSILLAAVSFALLGPENASPYWASGLLVLAYLSGVGWFLRRLPWAAWLAALLLFLTLPFITMGVVEFRPDIAWATVTGFGVVWIVTAEEIFRRPSRAALAGLLLGLSLLIKPTTFAMTGILYAGALLSRPAGAFWRDRRLQGLRGAMPGMAACAGAALLVAGPYWAFFGKDAWGYFWVHSFGEYKGFWAFHGSPAEFFLYYLSGEAFFSNVAWSGLVLLALGLVSVFLLVSRKPGVRFKVLVLFGLMAAALVINTLAKMKSPFLGGGIYGVWIFSTAYFIAGAWEGLFSSPRRAVRNLSLAALVLAAGIAGGVYQWPLYSNWGLDRSRIENYRAVNERMEAFLARQADLPPKGIFFTQVGPIVPEVMGLWFARQNYKIESGNAVVADEDRFRADYPGFEWIILQEPGVMGSTPIAPSELLLPRFFEIVSGDTRYRILEEFSAMDGKKIWIFGRTADSREDAAD